MQYRALCIGINAYISAPLRYCVFDAQDMAVLLETVLGFNRKNGAEVRLLCDGRATASNIMERLLWLVQADRWVLYQSGHGAQIADRNGDELDRLDELFAPVNFSWDDRSTMMLDDDYARVFRGSKAGSQGLFISDSCHSGDLVRSTPGLCPPDGGLVKALVPPADIAHRNRWARICGIQARELSGDLPSGVTAISACRSDQVSIDGSPGGGRGNGAFTWALMEMIRADREDTAAHHIHGAAALLASNHYVMEPQVVGAGVNEPIIRYGL